MHLALIDPSWKTSDTMWDFLMSDWVTNDRQAIKQTLNIVHTHAMHIHVLISQVSVLFLKSLDLDLNCFLCE
jgi:hypothetical protein